jgi:hypothetical protein
MIPWSYGVKNIILEDRIWVDSCHKTNEDQETNMPILN